MSDGTNSNGWLSKALPRLFTQVLPRVKPYQEMGVSGTPVYAGYVINAERNPKLIGQEKHRTFSDILTNTSIVAAGVRYFLNVVARPSWSFEPADDSDEAKKYAEFADHVLLNGIHTPWSRVVRRAGTYRFHGFHISEWTAMRLKDDKKFPGMIGFQDIESRPQWTIWRWEVDERGTVIGCWQRDPLTGQELGLPRTKIMYLVDDTLTDNPEGMGLLRHCVEPAERLREYLEQEAIGFLKDLRGIPIGRAPLDELQAAVDNGKITEAQKNQAIRGLSDFVTLEKKGRNTSIIVNSAPYVSKTDTGLMVANSKKWDVDLISSKGISLAEAGKAIDRLNYELGRILSCEHLLLGSTSSGSFALSKEKATDLYLMANSVLRDIRLQAQHDFVEPLWSLNGFPDNMKPKLKNEDVTPKDVEQIARVLRDMATAGSMIPPDDDAINFVRDLLGAPQLDLKKYFNQMMAGEAGPALGNVATANNAPKPDPKAGLIEDKQDAIDAKDLKKIGWTDAARVAALNARHARWKAHPDHEKAPHSVGGKEVPNTNIRLKDADGNVLGRVRSSVSTNYEQIQGQKYAASKQDVVRYKATDTEGKDLGYHNSRQAAQDAVLEHATSLNKAEDVTSIRMIRKVLGDTAADYIHDFVNSDNAKFKGKSKAERIRMALGAYYGKAQSASNGHNLANGD